MKNKNKFMLIFFSAGIELCWLYSWINFVMSPLIHKPFPLPDIIIIFILSAWATAFFDGKGWRIILISCIILLGVSLASLRIIYISFKETFLFWKIEWVFDLVNRNFTPKEYLTLFLALFWTIIICICGYFFKKRKSDYYSVVERFDFGIYSFVILFLFKLILNKNGLYFNDSMQEYIVISYLFFSISAIGLSRNRTDHQKEFIPGYKSFGILFSFILILLLISGGIIFLFKPYLTTAASISYAAMKSSGKTSILLIIKIIQFLSSVNRNNQSANNSSSGNENINQGKIGESSWWEQIIEFLMKIGLFSITGIVLLFFLAIILWYLFKWLFSKSKIRSKVKSRNRFFILREIFLTLIKYLLNFINSKIKKVINAYQLYFKLLIWGNFNGISSNRNETPIEYGLRLKKHFPFLSKEIDLIINLFNLETYSSSKTENEKFYEAKKAFRRLKSPLIWHLRIRMLLFNKKIL